MYIVVGRIRTVFGVRGWLKVQPFTDPEENLFAHPRWWLSASSEASEQNESFFTSQEIVDWKFNGKDWLVLLAGLECREDAANLRQQFIYLPAASMPELEADEVYLHQLEGMKVFQSASRLSAGQEVDAKVAFERAESVGVVSHILETGAADVVVLKSDDGQTLMMPYVIGHSVYEVDIENRRMLVDWVFD